MLQYNASGHIFAYRSYLCGYCVSCAWLGIWVCFAMHFVVLILVILLTLEFVLPNFWYIVVYLISRSWHARVQRSVPVINLLVAGLIGRLPPHEPRLILQFRFAVQASTLDERHFLSAVAAEFYDACRSKWFIYGAWLEAHGPAESKYISHHQLLWLGEFLREAEAGLTGVGPWILCQHSTIRYQELVGSGKWDWVRCSGIWKLSN